MALNKYITATQSLLKDPSAQRYTLADLTTFINTGRSQLALEGECVRFNFGADGIPMTGDFDSTTNTVLNVSPAAAAILDDVTGWVVWGLNATNGTTATSFVGTTLTMSANASVTGTASFMLSPPNVTATGIESYRLPSEVCLTNGIRDVIGVRSVALNWGLYGGSNRYVLNQYDWTYFQGYFRFYGPNDQGNPGGWSRYENNIFLRQIPSQIYPMEWDTTCSVVDLTDDSTPEAIPYAFTDAIPYFAAYLAMMSSQRTEDAQGMFKIYEQFTKRGRRFVQSTFVPSIYGG